MGFAGHERISHRPRNIYAAGNDSGDAFFRQQLFRLDILQSHMSHQDRIVHVKKNLRLPGECLPIDLYGCFGDDSFAIFNIKKGCSVSQNKMIIAKSSIFNRALDMISDSAITFPDLGAGHLSCPFVYIKF